jgi:hypothetical protein
MYEKNGPYDILTKMESDTGFIKGNYRKQDIRTIPQIRATTTLVISSKL